MPNIRRLDPTASPLDYFGSELRRYRESAGLSQQELGNSIFCTGSLVGQIETAHKVPTREFAERADAALMTDGCFSRLVGLVLRSQLPTWFQAYAEMEAKASYISTFQCQLVYGLLQTPEYARAVLGAIQPENLDELVEARMERQRLLRKEKPPLVWVVLDEAVLYRPMGGREVMRNQLAHLLSFRKERRLKIQVLPFSAGEHPSVQGSFNLLRFDDDPDIVYTEDFVQGHMTANPDSASEGWLHYDQVRAAALSVRESADLIAHVMEERYGDQPAAEKRDVA
ncbi:helix-turn-helix domain-containing protein [Streptomyces sp. D2-8]|uniref:helix-turn-helix domain-containing protein n=1 Tax=Streptomyces sp. D2-8 TaxID=2707767 RepID=UPI0020C068F5|nr:helix-turn-helix transcriptional regulator [Streptomyces sp. D2-8]MCK8433629.1 helix-turn-helix domain-containing protein [Streptomyces sp. D2-8]